MPPLCCFCKEDGHFGRFADTPGCLLLFMALERMKLPVFRIDSDDNESFTSLKTQDSLRWAQDSDLSDDDDDVITDENLPFVAAAVPPSSATLPEWIRKPAMVTCFSPMPVVSSAPVTVDTSPAESSTADVPSSSQPLFHSTADPVPSSSPDQLSQPVSDLPISDQPFRIPLLTIFCLI